MTFRSYSNIFQSWNTRLGNNLTCRSFHSSPPALKEAKSQTDVATSPQPTPNTNRPASHVLGGLRGSPTALDRIFLVWSGQFKSRSEIPRQLDADVIHRARSFARIRINIGFLFIAAAGAGLMVFLGKRAASRGETLEQQNIEWHRKIKEDYEKEQRHKLK